MFVRLLSFIAILFASYIFCHEVCSWLHADGEFSYAPIIPRGSGLLVFATPVVIFQMLALWSAGVFRSIPRYFLISDITLICSRIFVVTILLLLVSLIPVPELQNFCGPKRILLLDAFVASTAVIAGRLFMRLAWERKGEGKGKQTRIAVFGAGDAGAELISQLNLKTRIGKKPVALFDDDPKKKGLLIGGVPVIGKFENVRLWKRRYNFDEIAIAIPAAKITRIRELREIATAAGLKVLLVPSLEELSLGKTAISSLREFSLDDLLDRPPVNLDSKGIAQMLNGKTILVTGAGGSIGSEICRQVAAATPSRLVLVEQCEVLMFQVEQDLIASGSKELIVPEIADILDDERMEEIFQKYHPDIVFHAAAHKHVPLMERQPAEALKNNTLGSLKLFELATKHNVEACVMISTDKAINPTSAMGASKRVAETMLLSISQKPGNKTRFMAVRFGNVLGSSGSVIPTFKKQIAEGGPITVTSVEMKRYFMTIPEAVGLVLQTGAIGQNGGLYVLDMGEPVKIIDIARHLIRLSGLTPDVDIEIAITGLRPGEKVFEELKSSNEEYEPSGHPRISRIKCEPFPYDKLEDLKEFIEKLSRSPDRNEIKKSLCSVIPGYRPTLD